MFQETVVTSEEEEEEEEEEEVPDKGEPMYESQVSYIIELCA